MCWVLGTISAGIEMSLVRAWRQLLVAGWLLLGVEAISQFRGAGVCLASVVLQAWQSQLHESTGGVERRRDVIVHVVVDVIVVIFGLWRQRVHVGWRRLLALHIYTHARLTALFPGLPKRQWVAVASAGPYASLYLAPDRQSHQYPTALFFTGRMPFLPPNQQHQSTEGYTDNEIRQHFLCVSNLVRPVVFYEKPATDAHACSQ